MALLTSKGRQAVASAARRMGAARQGVSGLGGPSAPSASSAPPVAAAMTPSGAPGGSPTGFNKGGKVKKTKKRR